MKKLTVVIPAFNEENTIESTIRNVYDSLKNIKLSPEVLIIDDSRDKTYDVLKKLMRHYKDLKAIHRAEGKGVGSAIRLGIKEAKGKYVIVFMADSPHDTKYLPVIFRKLEQEYDIVQTSRFMKDCKMIRYPFKKRIFNRLCNNFINIAFLEFKLKDFSSLFKGFDREKVMTLNLNANEFDLGLEIVLKAMRKKYRITEVPVDWMERDKGESKLKLSKYAKHYFKRVIGTWIGYWG